MDDCLFCKIIKGEIPCHKIYEDDGVLAFLDIAPVNPGHTLVIPKKHFKDLLDLPATTAQQLISVAQKIAPAVIAGVGSTGFNFSLNNGEAAGQVIGHAHFHIMPRFAGDGYRLWLGRSYAEGEAAAVVLKIKENL